MPVINLKDINLKYYITASNIDRHHCIIVSDCPKCSSNLPLKEIDENGICTCKFCGKDVYVWED